MKKVLTEKCLEDRDKLVCETWWQQILSHYVHKVLDVTQLEYTLGRVTEKYKTDKGLGEGDKLVCETWWL